MSTHPIPDLSTEVNTETLGPTLDNTLNRTRVSHNARKKVMLIASSGGHWIEMTRLAEAFRDCHCDFVSTAPNLIAPFGDHPVVKITDGSRDSLRALTQTFGQLWRLIRSRRPDLIVSTGAAPGAIAMYIAKLFGIHTIWIDSVANSDVLSLSGRAVRPIVDLCLTQWPDLAKPDPSIQYFGRVL